MEGVEVVTAPNLRNAPHWPRYVPQAVALGVRSQMSLRLHLSDGETLGGINLYSTTSDDVKPSAQALAELFAAHSAVALGHAQERADLTEGLQTREVIGQAIGILMERYEMNEDRAFAFLVRASNHANIKLRSVARELVDRGNDK